MSTWIEEADAFLREASASSTLQQMAVHLGRDVRTVRWRCKKLGLPVLDGRGTEEAREAVRARRAVVERTDAGQRCTGCQELKPFDQFPKDETSPSGHGSKCKGCVSDRHRGWYDADPEKRRELQRQANHRYAEKHGIQPAVVYRIDEFGRECSKCREYKTWDQFHSANPKSANCKLCGRQHVRKSRLVRQYGITVEDYELLEGWQGGKCFLCGEAETLSHYKSGTEYYLSIDHAHDCGRHVSEQACRYCIRGLLCGLCNRTVGGAEARLAVAARFSDYLARRPLLEAGPAT